MSIISNSKAFYRTISAIGLIVLIVLVGLFNLTNAIGIAVVLTIVWLYAFAYKWDLKSNSVGLCLTISFIYIFSAYISSNCFSASTFHMAADPMHYIRDVAHASPKYIIDELEKTYILHGDNNGLYNTMLASISIVCRLCHAQESVFLLTLLQTLFGILTILTLYRILCRFFSQTDSYRYSLIFGCCSLVLTYSCIIVRDIILAFLFTKAVEIILNKFTTQRLIALLFMMIVAFGIRIFSGCFFAIFIVYYIYFGCTNKVAQRFAVPLILLVMLAIGSSSFADEMMNKTSEEVELYNSWQVGTANQTDGLSGTLRKLPVGLSNLALFLYSQANAFPPYSALMNPSLTGPQFYLSMLFVIPAIWWFYISYSLICYFFLNGGYKKIGVQFRWLYAIALLLILVSTHMHVDVRRIMPVYTIIYLIFLLYRHKIEPPKRIQTTALTLWGVYIGLNVLYIMVKF